ncbi:MAG: amino acid adenylation domain-containing protein [Thiohalocapsa sp.]|nr:amino acid adenylation domain-containing protein [Thiohalocapsa sp.]
MTSGRSDDSLPAAPPAAPTGGKSEQTAPPAPLSLHETDSPPADVTLKTPTEHMVAEIWQRLLGEPVARDDDFFELGGHSLLAAAMVQEVSEALGADVRPAAIVRASTLADFCAAVDAVPRHVRGPGPSAESDGASPPACAASGAVAAVADEGRRDLGESRTGVPTHAQEALWFLDEGPRALSSYNIARAWRIHGRLDTDAVAEALRALTDRHDALRTLFRARDGRVETVIRDRVSPDFGLVDFSAEPAERREASVRERLRDAAGRGFDLGVGPLIRGRVFRLSGDLHVLLVVIHHIVADGWSLGVVEAELGPLYGQASGGEPASLPLPAGGFADYARGQRTRVESAALDTAVAFWRHRLANLQPLPLPFDRPRGARRRTEAGREMVPLEPDLVAALRRVGRERGATLYMVLLAGLQTLLMRYCGVADVAVGTPVAGRAGRSNEAMVGYFANMIVLRSDLSGDPPFNALLERVRTVVLDALAHREVPFERLVALLQPRRDPGVNPLFQVSLALQNVPSCGLSLTGARVEPEPVAAGAAKFDLALAFSERDDGLMGELEYEPALFDARSVRRLGQHLRRLLRAAAQDAAQPLSALALDNRDERARLASLGTGRTFAIPQAATLADRFEAWVRDAPDAVAVRHGQETLTYGALNATANRIAHRLAILGVGAGTKVAVTLPRGAGFVAAVIAVIKLGAAYVPLDPRYPATRLDEMLDDAEPAVLITDRSGPQSAVHRTGMQIVDLDRDAAALAGMPAGNPGRSVAVGPDSLAYVIYTSGTTGAPKGVMVPQRGILRLCLGADYASLTRATNIGHASNPAFDAATFEIWGALLNGGRLTVIDQDTLLDPAALADCIADAGITTLFLTTALFNLHAARAPGAFGRLRELLFGGEAADPRVVARVLAGSPGVKLVNIYGPTETTTFATWHAVDPGTADSLSVPGARVPIGRPIGNTLCRVVDGALRPVPVGVVGELCVGGPGVALGYLGRPDLDAERFVELADTDTTLTDDDPKATVLRVYRTGDLVRWTDEGVLEYVGRNDSQIKLRGFRIEPGEIEHRLRAVPGAGSAVVWTAEHPVSGRQLVAAVSRAPGADETLEARARASLRESLPAYMVPSRILLFDVLPLTPNGKVDRRAIDVLMRAEPAAEATRPRRGKGPGAASNAREAAMIRLWSEILDARGIGPEDDFFDLGGYSLLGVRLLAAVEREFGQRLRFSTMFEAPTPRQLLRAVDTAAAGVSAADGRVVTIKPTGSRRPLFFISGYGGATVGLKTLADALGPQRPLYALDPGAFNPAELRVSPLSETAGKLCAAMRTVQPEGPYHLAGFSLGGNYPIKASRTRSGIRTTAQANSTKCMRPICSVP